MFCSGGWLDRSFQGQLKKAHACRREAFQESFRHSFRIGRWNSGRRRVQCFERSLSACAPQVVDSWRTSLVQVALVEESKTISDNAAFWRHLRECVTSVHERAERTVASLPRPVQSHPCDEWVVTLLASTPSNSDMDGQTIQASLDTTTVAKVLGDVLDLLSSSLDIVVHRMRLLSPTAFELGLCVASRERAPSWDDLLQRCRRQWQEAGLASTYVTVAFQREGPDRRYKRLAVFDLDSTLIQNESIDELAAFAGVQAQVARITEQAMRGEMDFGTAFRERVALLAGLEAMPAMNAVRARIQLTPGALRLVRVLRILGTKIVIASGGFRVLADTIREQLRADMVVANELEVDAQTGKVTGRVIGRIVDGSVKLNTLETEWERLDLVDHLPIGKLPFSMAVGDGANDLAMIRRASLGIAFNAKKLVRDAADACINAPRIDMALYLLGLSEREICMLAGETEA